MTTFKKDQTTSPLVFLMISSVDHISPAVGATPTVTLSKNGGAFGIATGAVSEIGFGWYKLVPNTSDFNTVGPLVVHATATGADPTDAEHEVTNGLVNLGPSQITDIVGNVSGSVGSVINPVTCKSIRSGC